MGRHSGAVQRRSVRGSPPIGPCIHRVDIKVGAGPPVPPLVFADATFRYLATYDNAQNGGRQRESRGHRSGSSLCRSMRGHRGA